MTNWRTIDPATLEAGPEGDRLIAEALGLTDIRYEWIDGEIDIDTRSWLSAELFMGTNADSERVQIPPYTTSVDAAMGLVNDFHIILGGLADFKEGVGEYFTRLIQNDEEDDNKRFIEYATTPRAGCLPRMAGLETSAGDTMSDLKKAMWRILVEYERAMDKGYECTESLGRIAQIARAAVGHEPHQLFCTYCGLDAVATIEGEKVCQSCGNAMLHGESGAS